MFSVVGSDGAVYGPVDEATIRAWIAQGRVVPTTNLIEPLTGRVLAAGQSSALADAFAATAPPVAHPGGPSVGFNATFNPGPFGNPNAYGSPNVAPYPHATGPYGTAGYPATPPRNKVVALLFAFFLGGIGIHRFYLGHNAMGIFMLLLFVLTCGWGGIVTGIIALVDLVRIATDSLLDAEGRRLT